MSAAPNEPIAPLTHEFAPPSALHQAYLVHKSGAAKYTSPAMEKAKEAIHGWLETNVPEQPPEKPRAAKPTKLQNLLILLDVMHYVRRMVSAQSEDRSEIVLILDGSSSALTVLFSVFYLSSRPDSRSRSTSPI